MEAKIEDNEEKTKNIGTSTILVCGSRISDIMTYIKRKKSEIGQEKEKFVNMSYQSCREVDKWDMNIKNNRYSQTNMSYLMTDLEKETYTGFIKPVVSYRSYYDEKMESYFESSK